MKPEWYGKNYGETHFGIAKIDGKYLVKEYKSSDKIPSGIVLPQPLHDNIVDRIHPSIFYLTKAIKFEWKAQWFYNSFHVLTISYKEIPVQFITTATAETVIQYIEDYLEIDETEILRRQVTFLQTKLHNVEKSLVEVKAKWLTIENINKELLSTLKGKIT